MCQSVPLTMFKIKRVESFKARNENFAQRCNYITYFHFISYYSAWHIDMLLRRNQSEIFWFANISQRNRKYERSIETMETFEETLFMCSMENMSICICYVEDVGSERKYNFTVGGHCTWKVNSQVSFDTHNVRPLIKYNRM